MSFGIAQVRLLSNPSKSDNFCMSIYESLGIILVLNVYYLG